MPAQRPSELFENKTNVHPVINRSTQATAEDFIEAGQILNNHADILNALLNTSGADFYGIFATLAALQAAYPIGGTINEGSYAIITLGVGNPIEIAVYTNPEGWQLVDQTSQVLLYTNRNSFPTTGQEGIWYIDKAATRAYLWYNGAYNLMVSNALTPARPFKKNHLPLNGVNLNQEPLAIVAEAILTHAPWTCVAGQKMVFYTVSVVGTQDNYGFEIRYYILNLNITEITVSSDLSITAADIMPWGKLPAQLVPEDDNELVAPLGNIGTDNIEDAFNLGNDGDPWVLKDILFVTATQNIGGDDVLKTYLFVAPPGLYGGDDLGTDPDILEAFAEMFIDITDEPTLPSSETILPYEDIAAMLAHQSQQTDQQIVKVTDASADPALTFPGGETRLQAYYLYLGTTNGTMADYELISAPYSNHTGGGNSIPVSKTGTTIEFTENALYNEASYLESGNLTLDLTDAVKGVGVLVYCDSYIPTISGETFLITSGVLQDDRLNVLSFYYDGTNILLNIVNAQRLGAPIFSLTAGDEEIHIDWGLILGADTYLIERDTDSGFPSPTEVYNGVLLTFTDTGLNNDTTYYYRAKAIGNGYLTSNWSDTESDTPIDADPNLLGNWDASIDASVTTANGSVTLWKDQTPNGFDLSESTKTPTHSSANNTISFTGVDASAVDILSRTISEFYFQQTDDFTVFVKGLRFTSGTAATAQHVVSNKLSNMSPTGWSINLAANGLTLYLSHQNGGTQNFASYALGGSGFKDDVKRDLIFINESGVLKIYDATNTNVGSNGSTSIGTITYTSQKFRLGCIESATNKFPFMGDFEGVKVWDKALNSTERDTELGI